MAKKTLDSWEGLKPHEFYKQYTGIDLRKVCRNAMPHDVLEGLANDKTKDAATKFSEQVLFNPRGDGVGLITVYCRLTKDFCPFQTAPKLRDPKRNFDYRPVAGLNVVQSSGCPGRSLTKKNYDQIKNK